MLDEAPSSRTRVLLKQRYELLEVIATGGQATVWRARDRREDQFVAVKMLSESTQSDPECVARLHRERDVLMALEGTSVVRLLDTCETSMGSSCLVLELLHGTDLEAFLSDHERSEERFSFERIREVLGPVVHTLHHAHLRGIVHRDLKPANIFLMDDGGVRVIDFGYVHLKALTRTLRGDMVMGSPCYIAPEVWLGRGGTSDERVDVYALGVIAFRMFCGRPPFESESLREMLTLATRAPRPSLHALRPDLPPAIDTWVQRALAIESSARYPNVRVLWDELCDALERAKRVSWAAKFQPGNVAKAWRKAGELVGRLANPALNSLEPRLAVKPATPPPLPSSRRAERQGGDKARATPDRPLPAPRFSLEKVPKVPHELASGEPAHEPATPSDQTGDLPGLAGGPADSLAAAEAAASGSSPAELAVADSPSGQASASSGSIIASSVPPSATSEPASAVVDLTVDQEAPGSVTRSSDEQQHKKRRRNAKARRPDKKPKTSRKPKKPKKRKSGKGRATATASKLAS